MVGDFIFHDVFRINREERHHQLSINSSISISVEDTEKGNLHLER